MRILFLLLLASIFQDLFAQKQLRYTDLSYEEQVKTVMIYPEAPTERANLHPSIASIHQQNLILEFDDIQDNKENYYAKIIHCNYDWSPSNLKDLDFIQTYNEVTINDFQYSSTLFLPYIHYRYRIPAVKIPGNYLLIVYRDGDRADLILSKRFMVYDPKVKLSKDNQMAGASAITSTNQQLNFIINYKDIEVFNPTETIHLVIRQNQRWDNAKMDVKPSFIREDINQLEYRFFDQDKQFNGGNEFRFVDFRSLNYPGQNTGSLNRTVKPFELSVQLDKSREGMAYSQYRDLNGGYAIENLDYFEPAITSNYLFVSFTLSSPQPVDGNVYVNGALNNWQHNEDNLMIYNSIKKAYEGKMVLKQGWYNYQYWVDSPSVPANYFEGSHFETENDYDVLVYYRSFQPNADLLVGYFAIPVNPRR
jgi:Domain of unknown function (DUF5103)